MADLNIDEQTMEALRAYARRTGRSVEQIVHEALDRFLRPAEVPEPEGQPSPQDDSLLALSGIGHSGQQDVSERTNEILRDEIDPSRGWTFNRDRSD